MGNIQKVSLKRAFIELVNNISLHILFTLLEDMNMARISPLC